jgi:hypothetical protein
MNKSFSSSFISGIDYDGEILRVHFHHGSTARYHNVPEPVVQSFINAGSKGTFYNNRIRGHYS